jgi:hypothetical protein
MDIDNSFYESRLFQSDTKYFHNFLNGLACNLKWENLPRTLGRNPDKEFRVTFANLSINICLYGCKLREKGF